MLNPSLRLALGLTLACLSTHLAMSQDARMIRVFGKVLSDGDSSSLDATILYEKLPYYDDMGIATTKSDGTFEFHLLEGTTYNIKIDNIQNHELFERELVIEDTDGGGTENVDFFVQQIQKEELITLNDLNFSRGSATIQPGSYRVLDEFIDFVNARENVMIQLEGHTDFAGNDEANLRLSQARVDAVAEYIIKNGVGKSRVTTKAFGGTQPLTTDRSDSAKAVNRRVEVRLFRP